MGRVILCGNHPTSKVFVGTFTVLATTDVIGHLCFQFVYVCNLTDLWHSLPGSIVYLTNIYCSLISLYIRSKSPLDINPSFHLLFV